MSAKSIHVGPDVTPKGYPTGKTRVTIPGGPKGHHTRTRVFDTVAQANDFASRLGKRAGIRVELSGRAAGLAKSARPTPWRGEYENERVHGHVRLKLIHLKLWGVAERSPAPARCTVTNAAALHTLDEAVATIAQIDAQAAPPSKRRWKKAMVAELTRLLGEAQAVVEGKKPIGLVKSATEMADLIAASRRKQGVGVEVSEGVLRNIARLVGAGGVCGLEDLVVEIYQQKYMHEGRARS